MWPHSTAIHQVEVLQYPQYSVPSRVRTSVDARAQCRWGQCLASQGHQADQAPQAQSTQQLQCLPQLPRPAILPSPAPPPLAGGQTSPELWRKRDQAPQSSGGARLAGSLAGEVWGGGRHLSSREKKDQAPLEHRTSKLQDYSPGALWFC